MGTPLCVCVCVCVCDFKNYKGYGVPVIAQWLTNPTSNHDVAGLIPGLVQWVKDLALQMQLRSDVAVAVV